VVSHFRSLRLTSADIIALVHGGEAERVPLETVRASQLSKHKLLLRAVVRFGAQAVPAAKAALDEHYELLATAERAAPEMVTAVLRHPHVGAWAARCLRRIPVDSGSLGPELEYLGAIAASAAIRAGHACSLTLRITNGILAFPTLGCARLPGSRATVTVSGPAKTTITADGHTVILSSGQRTHGRDWQGLRRLSFGDRLVALDDLDPNRSYDPYPLPARLRARDVAQWQRALNEAWHLLTTQHSGYAAALRDGLMSLVPIGPRTDDRNVSATSSDAFGAVAASIPADGATLTVALMHEFQHTKLCAINELEPLVDRHAGQLFYAPWRPDPRPAGALLHGIFAHMAVVDFWRVHRNLAAGSQRFLAHMEFARWLRQTHHAATLLDGHDALTAAGRLLLSHVLARLTGWLQEQVPEPPRRLAEETASDHLSCWRLRNLEPEPADVERLARDWLAGRPARGVVRTTVRAAPYLGGRNARADLLYLRLRDPAGFETERASGPDSPDTAYAGGDHPAAARGYLAQLHMDPARPHAWTGLGVTTGPGSVLSRCPEVAYAVHERVALLSGATDPSRLATWLNGVSARDFGVHV
jgi:HEXXH motif-containing protein